MPQTAGSLLKRRGVRAAIALLGRENRGVSVDSLGVFWMLRRTFALLQTFEGVSRHNANLLWHLSQDCLEMQSLLQSL